MLLLVNIPDRMIALKEASFTNGSVFAKANTCTHTGNDSQLQPESDNYDSKSMSSLSHKILEPICLSHCKAPFHVSPPVSPTPNVSPPPAHVTNRSSSS